MANRITIGVLVALFIAPSSGLSGTARADPGSVGPEQLFLRDVMSSMVPSWPSDQTIPMGQQACAGMAGGSSADQATDSLVMGLLNQGIQASNAEVGTLVHLAANDLCPQVSYR